MFIDSILVHFNLTNMTTVLTPLTPRTQLSMADCPTSKDEIAEMATCPYRELIGALSWLALDTQLDIAFATSSLACFSHNPGCVHWDAAKRILQYLKGTNAWCLRLGGKAPEVAAYMDTNWGSHCDNQHSIRAYIIKIGTGAISWKLKKQTCVALSSTEAEYMALCQVSKEAVWMADFLQNLGVSLHGLMVVNADNQGSIALVKNPVFHDCSKHIDIQYHYTCKLTKQERIQLNHIPTKDMLADVLTQSLPCAQHEHLLKGIGLS